MIGLLSALVLVGAPGHASLGPDGFITVWQVADSGALVASPGPGVDLTAVLPKRKWRKGSKVGLTAVLVASRAGRLRFKAGCTRRCEVRLDGKRILHIDKPYRAQIDDSESEVQIDAGPHRIEVRVVRLADRRKTPQTVILRVHDTQNRAPDWVMQPVDGRDAARLLAESLPIVWEKAVVDGGVRIRAVVGPSARFGSLVTATLEGAAPRTTRGERVVLEVVRGEGRRAELHLQSGGRTLRSHSTPYRADPELTGAVVRGRAALAAAPGASRFADARDTLGWSLEHLAGWIVAGDEDTKFLRMRAAVIDRYGQALATGRDPLLDERGPVLRAYRSELDGRYQVYALYVPPSWKPGQKMPLAVALHPSGYHPQLATRIALGYPPEGGNRHAARHLPKHIRDPRSLVVAPYGYKGTGTRYFGKVDVLTVIEKVARRYGVDRARISLSGGSLGGLGSWHLGLRMPDRFNVIAPMAGYGSVRHYPSVRGIKKAPWEPFLVDRRDNFTFVENAGNQPMLCIHGDRDNPKRSLILVREYRKLGYRHEYLELEDTGHNAWDPGYEKSRVFRYSRRYRRPDFPRRVRFVSGSYRHRDAYWVRIEQFERHDALGRVRGKVHRGNRVELGTENVRRLTLRLGDRRLAARLDGQELGPATGTVSFFRADDGRWTASGAMPVPAAEKRPGLSGPMDDVRYEPHVFVYGTADPAQTETNRRRAEHDARYFWNDAVIHMPVVADTELTDDDLRSKHLVLYGNPASNRVLHRMKDQLPARWEESAVVFGGRRFEGRSVGISFIYPNPLSPERYVLVHAGVTRRGTWLSAWFPRWVPDFLVYDEGIGAQRGGRLMDGRKVLAGGYFDRSWKPPAW